QDALAQGQVGIQHGWSGLRLGFFLNAVPQGTQISMIRLQFLIGGTFGLSADNESALVVPPELQYAFPQGNPVFLRFNLLGDADVRIVWQIDQHAPGNTDLRGEPRSFGPQDRKSVV